MAELNIYSCRLYGSTQCLEVKCHLQDKRQKELKKFFSHYQTLGLGMTHPTTQVTDTILQKGISELSITSASFLTKGNQLYFNFWVDGWEQIIKWKLPLQTSIAQKQTKMQLASSQRINPLCSHKVNDEACKSPSERIRTDCPFSKFKSPLLQKTGLQKRSLTQEKKWQKQICKKTKESSLFFPNLAFFSRFF